MHLVVGTPMYGGMCTGQYTRSMLDVIPTLTSHGVNVATAFIYNNSLITSARNQLAAIFMAHDFTHLMFIIWSVTQAYADQEAQFGLLLGKPALTEKDYEKAEELICQLVLSGLALQSPALSS